MHARLSQPHRVSLAGLAAVVVLCAALLPVALGQSAPAAAQEPAQELGSFGVVKDFGDTIYPGSSLSAGDASSFTVVGPIAYFQAYTSDSGYEIWRSDGTETGTFMLRDLCSGDAYQSSDPEFSVLGTTVYFIASDCVFGEELWKSDGTPGGTQRVKDINPGPYSSNLEDLFVVGDKLFFTAYNGTTYTIWKSDGTEAGTTSTGVSGTPRFVLGNGLFFTGTISGVCHIQRLDATNNTVADITTMCPRGIYGNGDGVSIAAGPALAYYTAGDTTTGTEVWRTDGTPAGTFLVLDILPGQTGSMPSNFFVNPLSQLIFSATDGTNGQEIWKSDGSAGNASMIKNINAGSNSSSPRDFTLWNNVIYFTAYDGTQTELWRTNGFSTETRIVKDLTPTAGVSSYPSFLTPTTNALFFIATDGTHAGALFKTDGTSGGTVLVKDVNPTTNYGGAYAPVAFGAGVFFLGDDGTHGGEPWFSDGTEAGTRMIKDIAGDENQGSRPFLLTPLNQQVLSFGYSHSQTSGEFYALYRSDGSVTGTLALKTFNQVPQSEYDIDQAPAVFNGALYFAASTNSAATGTELWRTDGTITGTTLFADIYPGPNSSSPRWLRPSGQTLYFRAYNNSNGDELWKTNGTLETTALVKDIRSGNNGSYPEFLTADGAGGVYFAATNEISGTELWHSDGTPSNTRLLLDIAPGTASSYPENLTLVGTNLFFTATDPTNGRELWVTNGTPQGTRRVRDITLGQPSTSFAPYRQPFAVLGNRVFFIASSALVGDELWSSDGTENGTTIVKDVYPGAIPSDIQELTVMGGAVYFAATSDDGRRTLWRSNGTTAGTAHVVSGTSAPVNPESLRVIDGRLYFSAADQPASAGRELWVSDGTAGGTRLQQNLNPGPTNSNPRGMVKAGNRIYLSAYKPGAGVELWSAQIQQTPPPPPQRHVYMPLVRR
jgi:ELWxxDGT repeat protein